MCPKNFRTRLRPVNVCCAIVASHLRRPRREGEPSECAVLLPPPGLNFRTVPTVQIPISGFSSRFRSSDLQNAKRRAGRTTAPARHNHSFRGLQKARNLTVSQRLAPGTLPPPSPRRVFLLPSRYGAADAGIRGLSLRIPTHSCVHPAPGRPGARFLHNPGVPGPGAYALT